jgi:hypothetical protein
MYELSRVRLFSVGPPGARYQDVHLDLRGVGSVIQAVVQEDLFALDDLDRAPGGRHRLRCCSWRTVAASQY